MKNNILIFLKDGYHFMIHVVKFLEHEGQLQSEIDKVLKSNNKSREDVQKILYLSKEEIPPISYMSAVISSSNGFDFDIKKVIDIKSRIIRRFRNNFLSELDLPLKISEYTNDKDYKFLIERMKFLRDLPRTINFDLFKSVKEVFEFNPFCNILKVNILENGSGYINPPSIIIESENKTAGLSASIKDGKVNDVIIQNHGYGYIDIPKITITKPDMLEGITAKIEVEVYNIITKV